MTTAVTAFDGQPSVLDSWGPGVRIALRLGGVVVFGYYLVRTGTLWPASVPAALIAASFVCWIVWVALGARLPGPALLALTGAPALVGSVLGAAPDRYDLAIVFTIVGIVSVVGGPRVSMRVGLAFAGCCLAVFEVAAAVMADHADIRLWTTFGICMAVVMGYSRRQSHEVAEKNRRLIEAQRQLLAQAETMRIEQARGAALAERSRIARDLHDVLAHSLGGLVVQLDAAEGVLSVKGDLEDATKRLRRARRLAVEGLDDARQAVTALRADEQELFDSLHTMVDEYDGGSATLKGGRPTTDISAPVTAALVAVVREALNNSRKHAAGADVTVWLRVDEASVRVDVTNAAGTVNDLATTGSGTGLTGMRERMDGVGGTVKAGPAAGGAWRVSASAPPTGELIGGSHPQYASGSPAEDGK